ncbi:MAG: pentapeptide repeat-containing protein [Clostridia bacterium]
MLEHSAKAALQIRGNLYADCEKCFALCCIALYFSTIEGFPVNKEAGQPCPNLQPDFRCKVHQGLSELGLRGCLTFDCFGAGQSVSQTTFSGKDWRLFPEIAEQIFEAFHVQRQIHELLWYLTDALALTTHGLLHDDLQELLLNTAILAQLEYMSLMKIDVAAVRAKVNSLLLQASANERAKNYPDANITKEKNRKFGQRLDFMGRDLRTKQLRGANLRGACLIAANLSGVDLSGTDLIGADFRDTDIRGTNLAKSIFLTQAQINAAKGDETTKLPVNLLRPAHWQNTNNENFR